MPDPLEARLELLERKLRCRERFLRYREERAGQKCKLSLSSGPFYIEGWLCTDIVPREENNIFYCDMRHDFPFEDDCFDFIFCEHGIEHIEFEEAIICLSECRRVLKKKGVLRLTTPALDKWLNYYAVDSDIHDRATKFATDKWLKTAGDMKLYSKCLVFNNALRNWDHKILYDFTTLKQILLSLEFAGVRAEAIGQSRHQELRNLERHGLREPFKEYNEMEVMILEAEK
ncbi:methyltransferase domain-containing protein [Desulfovibrio sp. OttesenSCG-928-G11]|nr:methyltransferase domain-containing protein [Desulfovibrio sp. OttesenSCG-928-G11]